MPKTPILLGDMRLKCALVDEDGRQAIGKFPSVGNTRSVTRSAVHAAISNRRQMALGTQVRLRIVDLDDCAAAFEQDQMEVTTALLGL